MKNHRLCHLDLHHLNQSHSCDWSVETKACLLLVNFLKHHEKAIDLRTRVIFHFGDLPDQFTQF